MKASEMKVVHNLVKTNGKATLMNQDHVPAGTENLTKEQGEKFDQLMTMYYKEHGLTA